MVTDALALFAAIKEVIVGVTIRGTNTKTIQPKTSNAKIPNPSLGRKDPDVIQANLEAGISGSKSCFHLGFRTITDDDPGTCTVMFSLSRFLSPKSKLIFELRKSEKMLFFLNQLLY
jgi:hypothetical protein